MRRRVSVFSTQICRRLDRRYPPNGPLVRVQIGDLPMSTGHPPHNRQDQRDEFLAALSPLLEEVGTFESQQAEATDFLQLLEENARLRKLAVKLSNLLGDLPERAVGEIRPEPSRGSP
jgi:hypothetical protein